jgi:hypothetical protein
MRRTTTGFVFTLRAMLSELTGMQSANASIPVAWIATANRVLRGILYVTTIVTFDYR